MQGLFADIDDHASSYLARLAQAASQPSIAATGQGIAEMAAMLEAMLVGVGFQVEQVPTAGSPVVFAAIETGAEKTLLFYNHYDVQPPEPLAEWESPPFEPTIRGGKFYARGAADNKGATIARLCAIESYLRVRKRLPVNLLWAVEGEEEVGSVHLHQFIAARKDVLQRAYGCIWEAGGKNAHERCEIALGCKGILYLELGAREAARDLHSALAATVASPVWRLLWALNNLKGPDGLVRIPGFYDDVLPPTPAQRQLVADWDYPEEQSRELYGIERFLDGLTGEELKTRLVFGPTCNVDGFHAGYGGPGSKTVLPCEAMAKVDFRLVPDQQVEVIVQQLRAHLDREGFADVEIAWWEGEAPSMGDPAHPFVQEVVRSAEAVYGHSPALLPLMAGTGPVHLLCGQFGIPITTAGVGYADSRVHAPNENIRTDDFFDHMRHVVTLLDRFEAHR
ncbi:MAG: M20/M25/M40 family metallo-hydrolase [Anaerolineae bacterium]|nr:M20/M25/M40 family metallo-hydrolase [Anaerolineae bacterium]